MDNIWQLEELGSNLEIRVHDGMFALSMACRVNLLSIGQIQQLEIRV